MKIKAFKAWLAQQGAEVLAPTNPYELVRFRAYGAVRSWGLTAYNTLSVPPSAKPAEENK